MLGEQATIKLNTEGSVVVFVDDVLQKALLLKASDVHLEQYEKRCRLRYRLDGTLLEVSVGEFLRNMFPAIVARIKILSSLDISERRLPQDGGFRFSCRHGVSDVRVATTPTVFGERVVMRLLREQKHSFDYSELGIRSDAKRLLQIAISKMQGMIVVCGPTGSGKTTTLYTILEQLNSVAINILTVEDPVERRINGLSQVQVHEAIGLDFALALRAFLRQDPEVILIGEIRDYETADVAIKAALTGHLVLTSLHTKDAATAIARLVNIGVPRYLVSAAVSLVVAQRLLRLNCPHCKQEMNLPEKYARALKLENCKVFAGEGCPECAHTGCSGRVGVFELLNPSEELNVCGTNNAEQDQLRRDARNLVASGKVSLAEYLRVFGEVMFVASK